MKRPHHFALFVAVALVLIAAAAVLLFFVRRREVRPLRTQFPAMGTVCAVSVYGGEAELHTAFAVGKAEFDRVEAACSLYRPDSELSRLNAAAGQGEFLCSEAMWHLILRAERAYGESGGEFDITVKPLMDLWGFYRKRGDRPPTAEEIRATLAKVGFDKLILDRRRRSIRFKVPGMALDLGGIAKGYAADLAAAAMVRCGITAGVVDLGGNLRFLPHPPPGRSSYRVAIRDPRDPGGTLPELLEVRPGRAVSTSGDYERFIVLGGRRYGHIISPKTGIPGGGPAASVVADTALDADVFSTSCMLGGPPAAEKLRQLHPGIQVVFAPGAEETERPLLSRGKR
ncbi:MAG: FAD:protein FMN transferase [Lentisphaeria bacterium]|nr:FAD:protein FMN transferase [Lentisphaeria bacterium]